MFRTLSKLLLSVALGSCGRELIRGRPKAAASASAAIAASVSCSFVNSRSTSISAFGASGTTRCDDPLTLGLPLPSAACSKRCEASRAVSSTPPPPLPLHFLPGRSHQAIHQPHLPEAGQASAPCFHQSFSQADGSGSKPGNEFKRATGGSSWFKDGGFFSCWKTMLEPKWLRTGLGV